MLTLTAAHVRFVANLRRGSADPDRKRCAFCPALMGLGARAPVPGAEQTPGFAVRVWPPLSPDVEPSLRPGSASTEEACVWHALWCR